MLSFFAEKTARRRGFAVLAIALNLLVLDCGASAAPPALPAFDQEFLEPLLSELPANVQAAIMGDIPGFKAGLERVFDGNSDLLVLVDKQVALPEDYVPPDLVDLDSLKPAISVKQAKPGLQLRRLLIKDYLAMEHAARKAGITLTVSSAYRSYQYQVGLFERNVRESGLAEAERVSARAGHSQHQLGLAIDFNSITDEFAMTKAGKWIAAHAAEYGFSLSYPLGKEAETGYVWECWHYRYLGIPACRVQKSFFDDSQQLMLKFLDRHGRQLRERLAEVAGKS